MKVSEIMTKDVISVGPDVSITEIAEVMSEKKIHAVPVVDSENKVLGIITETDFFTKDSSNISYMPSVIDFVKSGKMNYSEDEKEAVHAIINATAKDIMTAKCEKVSPDLSVEDFVKLIKERSFTSYPVVDGEGILVGIITISDAIKLL
jgi:CBS domain-containing protein